MDDFESDHPMVTSGKIEKSVDWRKKGVVTSVKR